MKRGLPRIWLVPALIAIAVVILDQLTKVWILQLLGDVPGTSVPLLGDWLKFTYVRNTGVAFGMFQNIPQFFTFTSILISIGALYFYRYHLPHHNPLIQICLGAIIGGAVGNIIDRVRQGYVVDFVHVTWFPGIFNFADACISCGVVAMALYLTIKGDEQPAAAVAEEPALTEQGS